MHVRARASARERERDRERERERQREREDRRDARSCTAQIDERLQTPIPISFRS